MNKKTITIRLAVMFAIATVCYVSLNAENWQKALHMVGGKLGICDYQSAPTATASVADASSTSCAAGPGCNLMGAESVTKLTKHEQKVVDYVCNRIASEGKIPDFTSTEIEKAAGLSLEEIDEPKLRAAVLAELTRRNINIDRLASASNCTKFSACSVDRDLSGAMGEELERYTREKSQDGDSFTNWLAPDFTLPTTAGHSVRLSEHRRKAVALVFLSGHCNHSHDMLPILAELKTKYESRGLVILPVFVNSGSVENIKSWSSELNLSYDLLVSKDKEISRAYDSRMVPSTFLIDREGRITKKFVGFKDEAVLDQAFHELVRSEIL